MPRPPWPSSPGADGSSDRSSRRPDKATFVFIRGEGILEPQSLIDIPKRLRFEPVSTISDQYGGLA